MNKETKATIVKMMTNLKRSSQQGEVKDTEEPTTTDTVMEKVSVTPKVSIGTDTMYRWIVQRLL